MISIVVLTKNEEKNILDCLESLTWADEIIIIDDYSTDLTEQVVGNFIQNNKIKFFKRRLENDFSSQRNFGLIKARYEWVLFVDADERVSRQLREEINELLIKERNGHKHDGFYLKRHDYMWGKLLKHGEIGDVRLLRFGRKNSGKWEGKVHESWRVLGNIGELENYIVHYPHQTISEFLAEINFYTSIRANELFKDKIKVSTKDIILYPFGKFILNYFIKLGILDGIEGLIFAIMMSLHSFMVRAKLWTLWESK